MQKLLPFSLLPAELHPDLLEHVQLLVSSASFLGLFAAIYPSLLREVIGVQDEQ